MRWWWRRARSPASMPEAICRSTEAEPRLKGGRPRSRGERRPRPAGSKAAQGEGGQEAEGQGQERPRRPRPRRRGQAGARSPRRRRRGMSNAGAASDHRPAGGDREELGRLPDAQGVHLRGAPGGQQAPDPGRAAEALRCHRDRRPHHADAPARGHPRPHPRAPPPRWKKAIVTLKEGDSIAVFEG